MICELSDHLKKGGFCLIEIKKGLKSYEKISININDSNNVIWLCFHCKR